MGRVDWQAVFKKTHIYKVKASWCFLVWGCKPEPESQYWDLLPQFINVHSLEELKDKTRLKVFLKIGKEIEPDL